MANAFSDYSPKKATFRLIPENLVRFTADLENTRLKVSSVISIHSRLVNWESSGLG